MEAVAYSFFEEKPVAGNTAGGCHFFASAAGTSCRTNPGSKPDAAADTGKCAQEPKEGAESTFFHLSFSAKAPGAAAADRTERIEESNANYITLNYMEGILV